MNLILCLSCCFSMICCGGNDNGENEGNGNEGETSGVVSDYLPIADPFILYHEGTYYAYGTSSDSGFEVYYTEDLTSWKKSESFALDKKDSYGDKWFWAPEVYYDAARKKFYLYYSADEHICVAISDSPLGPFAQDEKKPMRDEKSIDSSIFIDDDGTPYLYFVRFTNGNVIWVVELEKDLKTIKEETLKKCFEVSQVWETLMAKVVEGPSVLKCDGVYYLIYSANDYQSPDYGIGYATASSPLGAWKKYENNPILHKPEPGLVGTGHGAYFKDKNGNYKYVFHAHFSTAAVHPRTSFIKDLSISDKGVMSIEGKTIRPVVVK